MSRSKQQNRPDERHGALKPHHRAAINLVAQSLPPYRRNAFLLRVLASLKHRQGVSNEQVPAAIANALKGAA